MSLPIILLGGLVLVVLYVVGVYNGLVANKTQIRASVSEIGNQLKRQSELIPNLETSAKAYLAHEKGILKMLADARKMSDPTAKVAELLPKLQVIMESNPQMKGADVITNLMGELRDTSDKVMYSRRTMIDLTADYNIKLATFPSNLVANAFGFKSEKGLEMPNSGEFLKVSESETKTPKLSL
ncbi:MAG: LemA family protein [Patescibacteria group bacterium]